MVWNSRGVVKNEIEFQGGMTWLSSTGGYEKFLEKPNVHTRNIIMKFFEYWIHYLKAERTSNDISDDFYSYLIYWFKIQS